MAIFKKLAVLAAILLITVSAHAKTIKLATIAPDGSSWMKKMNEAADLIGKRTNGRVKLKFYTGGVMGNDQAVLRKVRVGQLDGGLFTLGGLSEANPDLRLYGIPFLFPNLEAVDRVRKELDPILAEGLKKGGFTSFGFAEGGVARLFSKMPVDSVDAMRGRKMWIPEGDTLSLSAIQSLGLSPVTLPIADVLTGLQTGLLDIAGNSSLGALALQWHTATSHITTTPLSYITATLAIKNSTFDELDAEDKKALTEILTAVYKNFDRQNREDEAKAFNALIAEGLKTVTPSPDEVKKWRETTSKLADEMAAKGEFSAELYKRAHKLALNPADGK